MARRGNQLGEVVAKRLGYLEEEGIHLEIHPGGPHIDGVGIVASGRYQLGQVSSSPSLMLAVGQGIPVQCFGVSVQQHPYSYFSLPDKPVRTPKDMVGMKWGRTPPDTFFSRRFSDDTESIPKTSSSSSSARR